MHLCTGGHTLGGGGVIKTSATLQGIAVLVTLFTPPVGFRGGYILSIVSSWSAIATPESMPLSVTTFMSLSSKYLEAKSHLLSPRTIRHYESVFSVISFGKNFVHIRLQELAVDTKPSTHRQRIKVVNLVLQYHGETPIELPRMRRTQRVTPDCIEDIKKYARDGHKAAQVFLLSYSLGGVRYGDLVSLKKENVVNGYLHYCQQKTGTPVSVPMNSTSLWCVHSLRGGDYLVPRKWTANWKLNHFIKEVHPRLQMHDARRLMAIHLHRQGHPLATIQAIGGWTSIDTAMHYCGSVEKSHLRQAIHML